MKFNTVLALGMGVCFLNIGAADHQQLIRINNKTGYDIQIWRDHKDPTIKGKQPAQQM